MEKVILSIAITVVGLFFGSFAEWAENPNTAKYLGSALTFFGISAMIYLLFNL